MSGTTVGAAGTSRRYAHSLWLLSARDLKVRYSTSALGYLWSVLDPLVMSGIYWFVFTVIFQRGEIGAQPYIVFLISALLPWVWFQASVSDFTKAFKKDARLVRSTAIPRSIWVMRPVLSKGIEFLFAMPVLVVFVVGTRLFGEGENVAQMGWGVLWLPVAIVLQAVLLMGLGLLVAPLCALYTDLERTTALIMRALFYASPIIYAVRDIPGPLRDIAVFNPLAGIFTLYRMAFFPELWDGRAVTISVVMSLIILVLGVWVFGKLEPAVLKGL